MQFSRQKQNHCVHSEKVHVDIQRSYSLSGLGSVLIILGEQCKFLKAEKLNVLNPLEHGFHLLNVNDREGKKLSPHTKTEDSCITSLVEITWGNHQVNLKQLKSWSLYECKVRSSLSIYCM